MTEFLVQFTNSDTGFHDRRWRKVEASGEQDAVRVALHSTGHGRLARYIRRHGRTLHAYVSSEAYRLNGRLAVVQGFTLQLTETA